MICTGCVVSHQRVAKVCSQASKQCFGLFSLLAWIPPLTLSKQLNFFSLSS